MTTTNKYKIVVGTKGFLELEEKVTKMLNNGWEPLGGIAFNQLHPYQAMVKLFAMSEENVSEENVSEVISDNKAISRPMTFNEALKDIDE